MSDEFNIDFQLLGIFLSLKIWHSPTIFSCGMNCPGGRDFERIPKAIYATTTLLSRRTFTGAGDFSGNITNVDTTHSHDSDRSNHSSETMKVIITLILTVTIFMSCDVNTGKKTPVPLVGTWQLIAASSTEKDSTFSTFNPDIRMIKIINDTHFAFFSHDLNHGKDSTAAFTAGGGTYTLADSVYTENLQYFIDREWEDHKFEFVVKVSNDTLTQRGIEKLENLGIDRVIVETYVRVKK